MRKLDASHDSCPSPTRRATHRLAVAALNRERVPFLLGGAIALQVQLGVSLRTVKDLDLLVCPGDVERALEALRSVGYATGITASHWLAKAIAPDGFIDILFGSGNGVITIDESWFVQAQRAEVLGESVLLCPPEEGLWMRCFVMERERFDGADVAHILRHGADTLDWRRLLERFGAHWRVLLAHLVLFGFIYPSERARIPRHVMDELMGRLATELAAEPPAERICRGTLLSRAQFMVDVESFGYADARVPPHGRMTPAQAAEWTYQIDLAEAGLPRPT
jgi:putative nucleotidyltransferase-like protein